MQEKRKIAGKGRKRRHASQPSALFLIVCTVPTLVLAAYFILVPTARAFVLSLTDSTILGISGANFVGLDNYAYMLQDKNFHQALGNTVKLMIAVPVFTLLLSLLLAFVISQCRLREKGLYRTLFFFPSVISLTVDGIIWSFIFHPTMGVLNSLLEAIGLGALAKPWAGDARTALWCVAAVLVWQAAGYYMVMYIAAMDGVSQDIYEAAVIDGANGFDKFFRITLPLIKNIIGITWVLSLSGTLGLSYVLVRVMTGGGPNGASNVMLQYIYTLGMEQGSFGYAMALTVFITLFSVALSIVSQILMNREKGGRR